MSNKRIIDSYKKNFQTPLGAYAYMLLNQKTPEFFVVHSDRENLFGEQLEQILKTSQNIEELEDKITSIPDVLFDEFKIRSQENDVSKMAFIKTIKNLNYIDLDGGWDSLGGIIEYNEYSEFVADKEIFKKELQVLCKDYSLKNAALNPNHHPSQFLHDFREGAIVMCETLGISPKQIGLGVLSLNYRTENGVSIGYVQSKDNGGCTNYMSINKVAVFAHEWMHFIDSALGFKGRTMIELGEELGDQFKACSILSDISEIGSFASHLNEEVQDFSANYFPDAIKSASHFFERFALNKDNFYSDVEAVACKFSDDIQNKKNIDVLLPIFESSIRSLLNKDHPVRYFSFLKAQCELYIIQEQKKSYENNQLIDFAKKADKYLSEEDYTVSGVEMFARTFESYLYRKANNLNCFVVASSYDSDLYPQGKMQKKMDELWAKMWVQIKNKMDKLDPIIKEKAVSKRGFSLWNVEKLREKYGKKNKSKPSFV